MKYTEKRHSGQRFLPPRFCARVEFVPQRGDRAMMKSFRGATQQAIEHGDEESAAQYAILSARLVRRRGGLHDE